jgi:hypothetical protein
VKDPRAFVDEQIAMLKAGDVDRLLASHYHPDALLVAGDRTISGHEALRAYFVRYVRDLGAFSVDSMDRFVAEADAILFEATVTSALGRVRVYDAFVLRDGRITHHFAGIMG